MKTFPLVSAIIKQFIRNWRSVVLLIGLPLILISLVFLSFNTEGLGEIPVGFVGVADEFNIDDYANSYFSFLIITKYSNLDSCIADLKAYREYLCININKSSAINLNVYYDNTKEPFIWQIIERVKTAVDYLQKAKSKEMASAFITQFSNTLDQVGTFRNTLSSTNSKFDSYISQTDQASNMLQSAKNDLSTTINNMDRDIQDAESTRYSLENEKNNMYRNSMSYIDYMQSQSSYLRSAIGDTGSAYLNNMDYYIGLLRSNVENYDDQADYYLNTFDQRIQKYESASYKGKNYLSDMDSGTAKLSGIRSDLLLYKSKMSGAEKELARIESDFNSIRNLDPEILINPILINNIPTYVPRVSQAELERLTGGEEDATKKIIKGFNLINLQTIFPKMLLLITVFLSLLISSFICLSEINSPANTRVKMIPGIFFPQLFSVYISSLLIMVIPITCVALLGEVLFRLDILINLQTMMLLFFLLSSIFILMGISIAYLIKKESVTLLITTFALVFFIFISGFILPIERMSSWASSLASIFPANLGLTAFNKVVFYSQGFMVIHTEIIALILWLAALFMVSALIKYFKRA